MLGRQCQGSSVSKGSKWELNEPWLGKGLRSLLSFGYIYYEVIRKNESKLVPQEKLSHRGIRQATPSYPKKILAKIFLPKKIPKSKISNPQKSFDHPCHLKSEGHPGDTSRPCLHVNLQMTNDGSVITSVFGVLLIFLVNAVFFSKDELHLPVEVTHGYVGKLLIRRDHRWISATVVRSHPHKVSKSSFFVLKSCISSSNPPWISVALHGGYGYFLELHILCRGFRIPIVNGIPDSSSCIPNSKAQDSVVCYTAVFSVVTPRSSPGALHDDTKYGCVAD